jgi:eukaryotic-like serine/threonine-protein kinase
MESDTLIGQYIGQYKVLEKIGQGGMAEVYKGLHSALKRYVAIKLLGRSLQTEATLNKRFQREAQAVAALRHSNIVQVYDFGTYGGGHYMVMEYIEGTDLRTEISRRLRQGQTADKVYPFDNEEVLDIVRQVASALDYAHAQGIVHRDVKPGNILLNTKGEAFLGDFGLVMLQNRLSQSTLGETFGTAEYIAPEQAMDSRAATSKSDVYSLGCIIYEMVTGHLPFEAESALSLALQHISEAPIPPHAHRPDLPQAVEDVILRGIAKSPEARYATAGKLVEALERAWQASPLETEARDNRPAQPDAQLMVTPPPPNAPPPELAEAFAAAEAKSQEGGKRRRRLPLILIALFIILGAIGGYLVWSGRAEALMGISLRPTSTATSTATVTTTVTPTEDAATETVAAEIVAVASSTLPPSPSPTPSPSPSSTPSPSPLLTATATPTEMPTETPTPIPPTATPTPTPTSTSTPTPTLGAGEVLTRTIDSMRMRFVPEGQFMMGASEGDPDASDDEKPQHLVELSAFWMDETEVTTDQYKACVAAGACEAPYTRIMYDNPAKGNHPMTFISWEQAEIYCQWVGDETGWDVQLPTEAQWEKAASWNPTLESKYLYPWGDTFDRSYVQLGSTTAEVGSHPEGASPYGVLDMAGNVREWVADWYDEDYYQDSPTVDPTGPESGRTRVFRGGSYGSVGTAERQLRTTDRQFGYPESTAADRPAKSAELGFRCAINAERLP